MTMLLYIWWPEAGGSLIEENSCEWLRPGSVGSVSKAGGGTPIGIHICMTQMLSRITSAIGLQLVMMNRFNFDLGDLLNTIHQSIQLPQDEARSFIRWRELSAFVLDPLVRQQFLSCCLLACFTSDFLCEFDVPAPGALHCVLVAFTLRLHACFE